MHRRWTSAKVVILTALLTLTAYAWAQPPPAPLTVRITQSEAVPELVNIGTDVSLKHTATFDSPFPASSTCTVQNVSWTWAQTQVLRDGEIAPPCEYELAIVSN